MDYPLKGSIARRSLVSLPQGADKFRPCWLALAIALVGAMPALAAPPEPVTREFRQWQAGCSQALGRCAAWAASDMLVDTFLVVERKSAPRADWSLSLRLPLAFLKSGKTLSLTAGDLNVAFERGTGWAEGEEPGSLVLLDAAKANRLFAAMAKAKELLFTLDGPMENGAAAALPLSGLSASLLWIEERQGMVGTMRILGQGTGATPDKDIAAARERFSDDDNLVLAKLPSALRRLREATTDPACAPLADIPAEGNEIRWLDARTALFSLVCAFSAGTAYHLRFAAHAPAFQDGALVGFPIGPTKSSPTLPGVGPSKALAGPLEAAPALGRIVLKHQPQNADYQTEFTWRWTGAEMKLLQTREARFKNNGETGPWTIQFQAPEEEW